MQPHEGPRQRPDYQRQEEDRQRVLTRWLASAAVALVALLGATWLWR
jgi:hypothetical protein